MTDLTAGPLLASLSGHLEHWLEPPQNREAFSKIESFLPTAPILRGYKKASELPRRLRDISSLPCLTTAHGEVWTVDRFLVETYTDAFMILRGNEVVFERYFSNSNQSTRHIAMSISKSFCGMLAGCLIAEGKLNLETSTQFYVPELTPTPYGAATVRQLLDMDVLLHFNMDYANPKSEVQTEDRCTGWRPRRPDDPKNSRVFLTQLQGDKENLESFQYCSATTEVLSWVLERAAKTPYAQLMSDLVWSRFGAEADAFVTVDSAGTPYACAGMGMTLQDLARFGRLIRDGGSYLEHQIIPKSWIQDTRKGRMLRIPDRQDFGPLDETCSYRNQWWITADDHGSFYAAGINGQYLWIDPVEDVVIAKFSSEPTARAHRIEHSLAFRSIASSA